MDIKIRVAQAGDAAFLSWVILTAGRAHVKKGIWEVILGEPEERCLYFLKQLSVTEIPHYFHYSCYLLAEAGGIPVAGLGGYDPMVLGNSSLWQALPEVLGKWRGKTTDVSATHNSPRILTCIPNSVEDAWVIDSVATVHTFRRKGIVGKLLTEMLEKGRQKGFKRAQVNIYIGNIPAQRLYEKHGFKIVDELHDPYFEAQIGSPGMARMLRDL